MARNDSQLSIPILYYRKCINPYVSIINTRDFNDVYLATMALEKSHKIPLCSTTNYHASMEISCKIIITLVRLSYDFLSELKHTITRYICTQVLKIDLKTQVSYTKLYVNDR